MARFSGPYRIVHLTKELIKPLLDSVMYVQYDDDIPIAVHFNCPCGGHDKAVHLPINGQFGESPNWTYEETGGFPTLSPSIKWTDDKACHFFVKQGMVQWC
jgi:hypothetical protein